MDLYFELKNILIYDSVLSGVCYEKYHNQNATPLMLQVLGIIPRIYCKRNSQLRTFRYPELVFLDVLQLSRQQ